MKRNVDATKMVVQFLAGLLTVGLYTAALAVAALVLSAVFLRWM